MENTEAAAARDALKQRGVTDDDGTAEALSRAWARIEPRPRRPGRRRARQPRRRPGRSQVRQNPGRGHRPW